MIHIIRSKSITNIRKILNKTGLYRFTGSSLVEAELSAYDIGFFMLEQKLEYIKSKRLMQNDSEDTLQTFENLLGLPLRNNTDITERKNIILSRFRLNSDGFIIKNFRSSLNAAGINTSVTDVYAYKELIIKVYEQLDSSLSISQIEHFVDQLVPAHLGWRLEYGSITFDMYDNPDYTFDTWDSKDKSWDDYDQNNGSLI